MMQQAIAWTNVDQDLCHHMASLDHNMLTFSYIVAGHAFVVTNDNGKVMKNNSFFR